MLSYCAWDFHDQTRGMAFENVSRLTTQLQDQFRHIDFLWTTDSERFSSQNGVARTNCST